MNELLFGNDPSTEAGEPLVDIASLTEMMLPFLLLSLTITILFIALYIRSALKRRQLEKAIFDIQKTVHEINQRDKMRSAPAPPPQVRPEKETIIARADEPSEAV